MAINVSVQYNGGLLPGIILLTRCYYHRGTRLDAMKRFYICSLSMIPPKRFDISPPLLSTGGCSEGLGAFGFFFKKQIKRNADKVKVEFISLRTSTVKFSPLLTVDY